VSEVVVLKMHRTNKILPADYKLNHDPDIAILCRTDGSVVAYSSNVGLRALAGAQGGAGGSGRRRVRVETMNSAEPDRWQMVLEAEGLA